MRKEEVQTEDRGIPGDKLVKRMCGVQWKSLKGVEYDAAVGMLLVKAVLDGVDPSVKNLSYYLGVNGSMFFRAFTNLSLNNAFGRIYYDRGSLNRNDKTVWGYYGGLAAGIAGNLNLA